jgi:hypothetical protein
MMCAVELGRGVVMCVYIAIRSGFQVIKVITATV